MKEISFPRIPFSGAETVPSRDCVIEILQIIRLNFLVRLPQDPCFTEKCPKTKTSSDNPLVLFVQFFGFMSFLEPDLWHASA